MDIRIPIAAGDSAVMNIPFESSVEEGSYRILFPSAAEVDRRIVPLATNEFWIVKQAPRWLVSSNQILFGHDESDLSVRKAMKIVLIIGLVLVSIVVVIAAAGMALPAKHVAITRTSFNASPDSVWSVVTDVAQFPSWRSDVKSVEILPAANGRPAWRENGSNGKISYEQEEAVRPSRLRVRLTDDSLPFGGTWTYVIAPVATGSEITITEDGVVRNPIFRFISRFVLGHHKTQETYLRDLGKKFNQPVTTVRL